LCTSDRCARARGRSGTAETIPPRVACNTSILIQSSCGIENILHRRQIQKSMLLKNHLNVSSGILL
jgi:hypothetical protein